MRKKSQQSPQANTDLQRFVFLEKQTCSGQTLHDVLKEHLVDDMILKYKVDQSCVEYEVFALRDRSSFDIKKALIEWLNPKEERMFSYDTNIPDGEEEATVRFYWRPLTAENLERRVYKVERSQKEEKEYQKEAKKQAKLQAKLDKKRKRKSKEVEQESIEE